MEVSNNRLKTPRITGKTPPFTAKKPPDPVGLCRIFIRFPTLGQCSGVYLCDNRRCGRMGIFGYQAPGIGSGSSSGTAPFLAFTVARRAGKLRRGEPSGWAFSMSRPRASCRM